MLKHTRTAILSLLAAVSLSLDGMAAATAEVRLPDATTAGFAERLYRLDCGHSLANDESVWTLAKMSDGASNSRRLVG